MTWPRKRPPGTQAITAGLYAVRRGRPQLVAPGDALRALPCLACGWAIGGGPAVTVTITHYSAEGTPPGLLPSSSWLVHTHHHGLTTRALHDLAQWHLATGETPTEEMR